MTMAPSAEAVLAVSLPVPHGFFTRRGGVSNGPFASLNCSLSTQDRREAVIANRARAARAIGLDPDRLVGLHQVHGSAVIVVTEPWRTGEAPAADAMVTDRGNLGLGIITADCAPVLLADIGSGVVGAAHAGWRSAVGGVIEATITAMETLGARRPSIRAAIGPCIGQDSYEVGADLRDAVVGRDPADERFLAQGRQDAHWQFDLAGYCAARLARAGVAMVELTGHDTCADEARFFSHRRRVLAGGGPIGHQIAIVANSR
jgi:YfiH family protein